MKMAARKGKQLALKLEKDEHGCWLFVHLGMAGSIIVEGEKELAYKSFTIDSNEWPPRYAKIELEFEDGRRYGQAAVFVVKQDGKCDVAHVQQDSGAACGNQAPNFQCEIKMEAQH